MNIKEAKIADYVRKINDDDACCFRFLDKLFHIHISFESSVRSSRFVLTFGQVNIILKMIRYL